MNFNQKFEDVMDNINNIGYGYGFKNGIDWANAARIRGELDWGTFKKYENAHELRVRFSHGNARDIAVSQETYLIAKEWEIRISQSRIRKEREDRRQPRLPDGTFRYSRPFVKEFNMTGQDGRSYYFRFEIVFEYQKRSYDDNSRFEGNGYTIYVKDAPYKEWCIQHNTQYEFHYYVLPLDAPSICWNRLITDFQAANAVMFTWVKRYCKILDQLIENKQFDLNRVDKKTNNYILPSGTFRNKKKHYRRERLIHIDKNVYDEIMAILGTKKPELGGMLGWKGDQSYIDYFVFDKDAVVGNSEYSPNTHFLTEIINGEWNDKRIFLGGFVHSHPRDCNMLSNPDVEYAKKIMEEFDLNYLFMPIVTSSFEYKPAFNPYIILKNGTIQKCRISFTNKIDEQYDDFPLDLIKSIEEAFDNMPNAKPVPEEKNEDKDEIFSRISDTINIEYMYSCSIIGIGCGGSRSFYESMARIGVGNFYLMDGDKSSFSNIASQNGYISDVDSFKPEIIRKRILDINEKANVNCFNYMLNNDITDGKFEEEIIAKVDIKKTIICAFTDDFYAQARASRIALKYGIPFIAGQHHEKGYVSELIYHYPGISKYSLREIARSRYKSFKNGYENKVTSHGSPIFNTTRLNALCEKIATGLLLYNYDNNNIYCSFLRDNKDKNLILIKQCCLQKEHQLYDLFKNNDCFFDETIWINPETIENLDNVELEEKSIGDTRDIFENFENFES